MFVQFHASIWNFFSEITYVIITRATNWLLPQREKGAKRAKVSRSSKKGSSSLSSTSINLSARTFFLPLTGSNRCCNFKFTWYTVSFYISCGSFESIWFSPWLITNSKCMLLSFWNRQLSEGPVWRHIGQLQGVKAVLNLYIFGVFPAWVGRGIMFC